MQIRTPSGQYVTRSANANLPWGSSAPPTNGQIGMSFSGMAVTPESALQLAAVWGSVAIISDSIATLPIRQWRLGMTGEPVAIDSAPVIAQPWPEITQGDFIEQGTVSLLMRGNVFGKITDWTSKVYPNQVQMIPPNNVNVRRNGSTGQLETRYWNLLQDPDAVTRAMGLSLPGGFVGLNPIEYMRNSLGVALAQDLYNGSFYANSARPDGVIQVKGDMGPNEAAAMAKAWLEGHQGVNHAHLPAVLTGDATWQPVTMNMVDAQFLQMMGYSDSKISGMIYRVPPHMLGMVDKDTSWGAGIEQQELGYVRNTLGIWLKRWEDLLSSWLPPREFVTFDLSTRLRGDTLQRYSAYQIARVIGSMNNLEIMKAEGQTIPTDPTTLELLSKYDQPLNSAPVKPTATGGAGGDKSD